MTGGKEEKAPRFAGIGGHHSHRAGTVEWLTPPELLGALGPFDLDPCAPVEQPWPTAARRFTKLDNGLALPWDGRIWLNPPYANGVIGRWLARMAEHDHGTALIFARTETEAFCRHVWDRSSALLFVRGRINFLRPDGTPMMRKDGRTPANSGAPSVLCAYGADDADILAACKIDGQFVPLRFPRSVLGALISAPSNEDEKSYVTWREVLAEFFSGRSGTVELADLYRFVRAHPKAAGNRNPEAKARQELQRGPYRRVDRGLWEAA